MRERERNTGEIDWGKVLIEAIEENLRVKPYRENLQLLTGRVFESLGYEALSQDYPPPDYTITTPGDTAHIRKLMRKKELAAFDPHFPDGLILQNINQRVVKLVGVVEYKMSTPFQYYGKLRNQFKGFTRLIDFLGKNNAQRGKEVLGKLLRRGIVRLEVPQNVRFIYVSPLDTAVKAKWIPTTSSAIDNFQEKQIPLTSKDIRKQIRRAQRKIFTVTF